MLPQLGAGGVVGYDEFLQLFPVCIGEGGQVPVSLLTHVATASVVHFSGNLMAIMEP